MRWYNGTRLADDNGEIVAEIKLVPEPLISDAGVQELWEGYDTRPAWFILCGRWAGAEAARVGMERLMENRLQQTRARAAK